MLLNVIQQNFDSCAAQVQVKKLRETAKIPYRGSEKSAGYDLYADIDEKIVIKPHTTEMIGTGLSLSLPDDTFAAIVARSGLATKNGLAPANKIGVCDADYRGEYMVALHNHSDEDQYVEPGMRIAQLIVLPFYPIQFNEQEELDETERGEGGFNSTGLN